MPVPETTEQDPKAAAQFGAALNVLFIIRGVPSFIRSDNTSDCVAEVAQN